jgi:hypothetical protein
MTKASLFARTGLGAALVLLFLAMPRHGWAQG